LQLGHSRFHLFGRYRSGFRCSGYTLSRHREALLSQTYKAYTYPITNVVTWLGLIVAPTMFGAMPFCAVTLSMRCMGMPAAKVLTLATIGREGPMKICETRPPMTPPKSPRLMGTV